MEYISLSVSFICYRNERTEEKRGKESYPFLPEVLDNGRDSLLPFSYERNV